jgi:peptide-methionine (S)-S-oxide reductase
MSQLQNHSDPSRSDLQTATLGGGCFWCLEAVFQLLEGVVSVESGYAGGDVEQPTYQQVSTGTTGHAEVVQVRFDPAVTSYREILEVFFSMHDPTTLNRQGADIGPQYRSIILYHDDLQRATAQEIMRELQEEALFARPIVTELAPFTTFHKAEAYHQDYYRHNPNQGYCQVVIAPKVAKFRQRYSHRFTRS